MQDSHVAKIAVELSLAPGQVQAVAGLLEEGGTVPFIARYRKEATGSLDEVAITTIRDRLEQLAELDKRREAILKSLEERQLLTEELNEKIRAAETMAVLEDIYLPFRPKRRTRATIAKEKGLEPLAILLFAQEDGTDPAAEAAAFVDAEKGVESVEDALAGARDIIAEWVSEDPEARAQDARSLRRKGPVQLEGHCRQGGRGGEVPGLLRLGGARRLGAVAPRARHAPRRKREGSSPCSSRRRKRRPSGSSKRSSSRGRALLPSRCRHAVHDGYKRLLCSSMETEIRLETKKRADEAAIRVFAENLRELLLAPPLGQKNVLAIDPGFRTGCKVVCLDRQGKLLHNDTIYPHFSEEGKVKAAETVAPSARSGSTSRPSPSATARRAARRRPSSAALGLRQHPDRHGERERRLGLLRLGGRPRGVPRPGRDGARRGLHRPPADGPAGRTGQDRPQGDRRRAVPARRRPGRPQAQPRRRGVELRQRRRRRGQHGQPAAPDLRLGPRAAACRGTSSRTATRTARFAARESLRKVPAPGPEGLRAGGGLSAHPRRGEPARRQRRPPRELPPSSRPWPATSAAPSWT